MAFPRPRLSAVAAGGDRLGDRVTLALLAGNVLSVATMAAVLSSRLDDLPASLVLHLDATGAADRWGPPDTLWRLPLLAGMTTALNLVGAWVLASRDRFASQFLVAAALIVQVIAWVAVLAFV